MTSLNQTNSIQEIVKVRTRYGILPAIPIGPVELGGSGDFVVFGLRDAKGVPQAAGILKDVPFGARGGDGRTDLLPYWDIN